jgi:GNAT superfamily N-acetyltransferase
VIRLEAVEWTDVRAVAQRAAMDAEMGALYEERSRQNRPEVNAAIDAALSVDPATIVYTVLALDADEVVGHSALRPVSTGPVSTGSTRGALEVKKVFVDPRRRGAGVARVLLAHLEDYARERGVASLVLQTGPLQHEAIALYEKIGYVAIDRFGAYVNFPGALCFEKQL